jgi:predicted AAA+ superfamily ATPase
MEAVFLLGRLPAWGTTLGSRVQRQPKVYIVDAGVMAWLLKLTPEKVAQNDPSVLSDYGHLVETFAVREILAQASWWEAPVSAGHFRSNTGDEVDLVLERDDGQVVAFEVKAGTRIHAEDLRGMRTLRFRLGKRLEAAVVLYTGAHVYSLEDSTDAARCTVDGYGAGAVRRSAQSAPTGTSSTTRDSSSRRSIRTSR